MTTTIVKIITYTITEEFHDRLHTLMARGGGHARYVLHVCVVRLAGIEKSTSVDNISVICNNDNNNYYT